MTIMRRITMDEKRMLRELKELMEHPVLKKIIYHKLGELKEIISADPTTYWNELKRFVPKETIKAPLFGKKLEFELILFGETVWIPSIPDSNYNAYEYIPEYVIDFILETETDLYTPHMWNNITFGERTFDLTFTKDSEIHFTGSIVEKNGKVQNIKRVKISRNNRFNDRADIIKTLIQYMFENDAFFNHIVHDFIYKWKPFIDKKRISNAQ
jgi:hypothetical protein